MLPFQAILIFFSLLLLCMCVCLYTQAYSFLLQSCYSLDLECHPKACVKGLVPRLWFYGKMVKPLGRGA
jgi:hypothetical protein